MKRILLSVAVIAMTLIGANAKPVDPAIAAQRAAVAMRGSVSRMVNRGDTQPGGMQLVHTLKMQNEQASVYVFNIAGGGFVIASADDSFAPVLGYSDEGAFDLQNCPDGLRFLLDEYNRIVAGENTTSSADAVEEAPLSKPMAMATDLPASVSPLLGETMWDQSAPYNLLCPSGCPTGCVATAMAQVMYYHRWPERGTGSHSYRWGSKTLSSNFADHTYAWNSMLPRYKSVSYTNEQANAVAQLCYDAGISVDMYYAAGGSGTSMTLVPGAMKTYFGYSETIEFIYRNWYCNDEWNRIMMTEVANNRPVLLAGQNYEVGHAFVCDGYYQLEGHTLFHINWGWSGMSNGYFLLSGLDPDAQGIGGSSAGYNVRCNATVGVQPSTSPSTDVVPVLLLGSSSSSSPYLSVSSKSSTQYNINASICNYGLHSYNGKIAYVVENADGTVIADSKSSPTALTGLNSYYMKNMSIAVDKSVLNKEGIRVYVVHCPEGSNDWKVLRSVNQTWYLESTDANGTFVEQTKAHLKIAGVGVRDTLYSSCPADIEVTFTGVNEYYGQVRAVLLSNSGSMARAYGRAENLFVEEGGETTVSLVIPDMPANEGSYKIAFQYETSMSGNFTYVLDESGKTRMFPVVLKKATEGPVNIELTKLEADGTNGSTGSIVIYCEVYNNSEYTNSYNYKFNFYRGTSMTPFVTLGPVTENIYPWQKVSLSQSVSVNSLSPGKYYIALYVANKRLGSKVQFDVPDPTGIEDIEADSPSSSDIITFNLLGQQVSPSAKGIVIRNGKKYLQK